MYNLSIFGGCSNAGKTTVVEEIGKRHSIKYGKKLELIKKEAKKRNILLDRIFDNFDYLEINTIKSLLKDNYKKHFLLDTHYAIQSMIDNAFASGKNCDERINEPYSLSFCKDTINIISENFFTLLFYIHADPNIILKRRITNFKDLHLPQRCLEIKDIEKEIENEYNMFLKFYEIAKQNRDLQKYVIENKEGHLEETIIQIESILGLK
jgi:adenylate kinase